MVPVFYYEPILVEKLEWAFVIFSFLAEYLKFFQRTSATLFSCFIIPIDCLSNIFFYTLTLFITSCQIELRQHCPLLCSFGIP